MEIKDYLNQITDKEQKIALLELYNDIEIILKFMPAAVRWHHSEEGGLYRHTKEVIEAGLNVYGILHQDLKKHKITKDDVILVCFVHDLEKLDKYKKNNYYEKDRKYERGYKETEFVYDYNKICMNDTSQVVRICAKYSIILSDMHLNAITFHHGGWSLDAKGTLEPLAVVLHTADLISANLYKKKR